MHWISIVFTNLSTVSPIQTLEEQGFTSMTEVYVRKRTQQEINKGAKRAKEAMKKHIQDMKQKEKEERKAKEQKNKEDKKATVVDKKLSLGRNSSLTRSFVRTLSKARRSPFNRKKDVVPPIVEDTITYLENSGTHRRLLKGNLFL